MTYNIKPDNTHSAASTPSERPVIDRKKIASKTPVERLTSLDAFRGFIMMMLVASGFGILNLSKADESSKLWSLIDHDLLKQIAFHFSHPDWQSNFLIGSMDATEGSSWLRWKVSFWDLIQPSFMFMVGLAMPFSYARRNVNGQSAMMRTLHALIRAVILVLLGVFLSSTAQKYDSTNWLFTNVLSQIGLGYFFVYLLLGVPRKIQIGAAAVILIATWAGMQFSPSQMEYVPEEVNASYERGEVFLEPYARWSKNGNAFHEFDLWFINLFPRPQVDGELLGEHTMHPSGYTTLNFVPSMATILLGLLCGQFVMTAPRKARTFLALAGAAAILFALGVVTGATCCPIVKKIWTPSWVLFSGGYVIGIFSLFYLLFDLLPFKKLAFPLVVLGMNSIFLYIVYQLMRPWLYSEVVKKHLNSAIEFVFQKIVKFTDVEFSVAEMQEIFEPVTYPTSVFIVVWLVCFWMYRQRLFVRI